MMEYNECAYKKIKSAAIVEIVVGIVFLVIGVAAGVVSIVFGARALKAKNHFIG